MELQGWQASPQGSPWGPLVGKRLVQSEHRDSYSPTGRSSGRVTNDMLDRNVGAMLADTVGTQSVGTSGHLHKDTPICPCGSPHQSHWPTFSPAHRPRTGFLSRPPQSSQAQGWAIGVGCLLMKQHPILLEGSAEDPQVSDALVGEGRYPPDTMRAGSKKQDSHGHTITSGGTWGKRHQGRGT